MIENGINSLEYEEMYGVYSEESEELKHLIEAYLFLKNGPVRLKEIYTRFVMYKKPLLIKSIELLTKDYLENCGALAIFRYKGSNKEDLIELGVKPDLLQLKEIKKFTLNENDLKPLSLKVLALIAYNQPIEEQEISDIFGTSSKSRVRELIKRRFITKNQVEYSILDENEKEIVHKTNEYSTTEYFAHYLGVENNLDVIREKLDKFVQ